MNRAHARWVIYLTLGAALVLMLLPFSVEWRSLRPDIVSLALFYWVLALPHRVGITTAFAVGISQDLIEGAPLGLSSPGLMLATLLLLFSYQRIRQFDPSPAKSGRSGFTVVERGNRAVAAKRRQRAGDAT